MKTEQQKVWIGVVGVLPRPGCELLSPDKGAYINFLTFALDEKDYRAKVIGALNDYCLELIEFEDVRPLTISDNSSGQIHSIAEELINTGDPRHVRYSTFHIFPRLM